MNSKKVKSERRSNSYLKRQEGASKESIPFSDNDFFKGLKPEELAALFEKVESRTYASGSLIFMPEELSCEKLYLLSRGQVEMYRLTVNGKRLVTRHISPGGIFGIRGLLGRSMQKNFAEATEDSLIGVISREQVLSHLKRQPDLMLRIMENVCSRLYLLEDRLVEAVYNPASVRLAYFLMANADTNSGILKGITHEEIGNRIGAVRQTVTENLNLFKKGGLITIKSKQIQIMDRHKLEKLVQGSETQIQL
jgi:CRP-like cAMP-binding protein